VRGIGSKLENQRRSKMVSKGLRHYNRRISDPKIDLPGTPDPEEFLITGGMERVSAHLFFILYVTSVKRLGNANELHTVRQMSQLTSIPP